MSLTVSLAPVGICQGYDSVRGDARNTALSATVQTYGGDSYPYYRVCKGMEETMKAMEISQSLSIDLFSVFSINQKLEFVKSQKLTSNSVCIVLYAKHTEGTESVTDVELRPDVKAPKGNKELREFFQAYGDSYVVSRTRGGEYYGVYTYYAETLEQQSRLTAEMEVAGLYKAVAGDAGLQAKINNFQSSESIRTTFDQNVTGIANPTFPLPDDAIDYLLAYPSLKLTAPVLTHFEITGYHRTPGIGSVFRPIAENVEWLLRVQHDLAADRSRLQELQNAVRAISDVYAFYGSGIQDDKLQQVEKQVERDLEAIQAMLDGYEEDPAKPLPDNLELSSLRNGMPALAFVTQESKRHGEGDDEFGDPSPFDDVSDIQSYLQQRTRITAVEMLSGGSLDSLMVSYDSGNTGSWTVRHGKMGARLSKRLVVPQEHLVSMVQGHYSSSSIDQLIVELTNGEKLAAGSKARNEFMSPTPDNFFLVGFRGLAGYLLNQLQMRYASFIPAVWTAPN